MSWIELQEYAGPRYAERDSESLEVRLGSLDSVGWLGTRVSRGTRVEERKEAEEPRDCLRAEEC